MTVLVSGGFDPLHVGHLDLINDAKSFGQVVVALNSDEWLMRKKGYVFMPWHERSRILMALEAVANVTAVSDGDGTVCEALRRLQPRFFANGGDRKTADQAEHYVCRQLGITELFNMGGGKTQSSSKLVEAYHNHHQNAV